MKHRSAIPAILLTVLTVAVLPLATAAAQYTTFVAPPRKVVDSAKQVIAEQKAQNDSAARMTISDMKAWVDSAAGVSSNNQVVAADTASPATQVPAGATTSTARTTTTFSSGAIAPDTASSLPTVLIGGVLLILCGGLLLTRRTRSS